MKAVFAKTMGVPVICFILTMTLFTSCNKDARLIRQMCLELHSRYPQATLQDVYKTCYQDYFGAEHLMTDTAAARMYLHRELEECRDMDLSFMPKQEPTGFRHRFTRINLSSVVAGELTENQLLERFIGAAGSDNAFGQDWAMEWEEIVKIALQVCPEWSDPELQSELQKAAQNKQAVRHSEAFRTAYHPHYRIVFRI